MEITKADAEPLVEKLVKTETLVDTVADMVPEAKAERHLPTHWAF